jgi:hypothetical protein
MTLPRFPSSGAGGSAVNLGPNPSGQDLLAENCAFLHTHKSASAFGQGLVTFTTAERPTQPAVEYEQFRVGSVRNKRCRVRAVGDEEKWLEKYPRILQRRAR